LASQSTSDFPDCPAAPYCHTVALTIDISFLWSFGELRGPLQIRLALGRYNVWIKPVLIARLLRLMESYAGASAPQVRHLDQSLLAWGDPERDTRIARDAVAHMRAADKAVYCVWSRQRLPDDDTTIAFPSPSGRAAMSGT
jgi:hypothetical protein